jgi:hypothetical protein
MFCVACDAWIVSEADAAAASAAAAQVGAAAALGTLRRSAGRQRLGLAGACCPGARRLAARSGQISCRLRAGVCTWRCGMPQRLPILSQRPLIPARKKERKKERKTYARLSQ